MRRFKYAAFGELLRQARAQSELAQAAVSKRIGVSNNYYGVLERGRKLPSLPVFGRLWRVLGFDVNELLDTLPVTIEQPSKWARREAVALRKGDVEGEYLSFGRVLASARRNAQVTQRELARVLGYRHRMLSRIENGHILPTLTRIAQLRKVLGVDGNELLRQLMDPGKRAAFYGFGRAVELARIGLSMTPQQVAEEIGCQLAYYRSIERGVVLPTIRVAILIHRVTGFDVATAFRWVWQNGALESGPGAVTDVARW